MPVWSGLQISLRPSVQPEQGEQQDRHGADAEGASQENDEPACQKTDSLQSEVTNSLHRVRPLAATACRAWYSKTSAIGKIRACGAQVMVN